MARRLDSKFLEDYLEGGRYHEFLNYVKSDTELQFEIRIQNKVMIYCEKNLILTIEHKKSMEDTVQMLSSRYLSKGGKLSNLLTCAEDLQDIEKVKSYFNEAKSLCKKYKSHDEFIVQQWYKSIHNSFDGDYLVLDMEWAPEQKAVNVMERITVTNVDLIAVSNKPNERGENDVFLVEVKCGLGACDGDSGIQDHYIKSQKIINTPHARQNLLSDVSSLINQKKKLGLFRGTPVSYKYSQRPKIMFVLACNSIYDEKQFKYKIEELGDSSLVVEYPDVSSFVPLTPAKTGMYESKFKASRREHMIWFRENILHLAQGKYANWLTKKDGARLENYVASFRDKIKSHFNDRFGKIPESEAMMEDLLASNNIPWNTFVPMMEDKGAAINSFREVTGRNDIKEIVDWEIEKGSNTLNDLTAFDAYFKYTTTDGKTGIIGIEIKYTEEGYTVGPSEFKRMLDPCSRYSVVTRDSGCFLDTNPLQFNYCDLIQIWRNHMLGISMMMNGEIDYFHSITIYPSGNEHFHSHGNHKGALEVYEDGLTEKGKESFGYLTYENLFSMIKEFYTDEKFLEWIDYLNIRYLSK